MVVIPPELGLDLVSRLLDHSSELGGRSGNWVDGAAGQGTGENPVDEYCHLVRVRVAV